MKFSQEQKSLGLIIAGALVLAVIARLDALEQESLNKIIALGTIILGPLGSWFFYSRNRSFERQAITAEGNLQQAEKRTTNESFIKAIELLGATGSDGEPILEQRLGAIYALERLARDNLDYHVQIMETLCAYVREHAPARPGDVFPGTVLRRLEREHPDISDEGIAEHPDFVAASKRVAFQVAELRVGREEAFYDPCLTKWLKACKGPREDIRAILEVISRRNKLQREKENESSLSKPGDRKAGFRLDLRDSCLRNAGPSGRHLDYARLDRAQMEGIDLRGVWLRESDAPDASLEGAQLLKAQIDLANWSRANLYCANLGGSSLRQVGLRRADLLSAVLNGADLTKADLVEACLEKADIKGAILVGAGLRATFMYAADLRSTQLSSPHMEYCFLGGDEGLKQVLSSTDFGGITNEGGAIRFANITRSTISEHFLLNTFGDGTVALPARVRRPAQWLDRPAADDNEFFGRWRGWIEAGNRIGVWKTIAPAGFTDVEPIPPPDGITWTYSPAARRAP